jgi:hypothetical protein
MLSMSESHETAAAYAQDNAQRKGGEPVVLVVDVEKALEGGLSHDSKPGTGIHNFAGRIPAGSYQVAEIAKDGNLVRDRTAEQAQGEEAGKRLGH